MVIPRLKLINASNIRVRKFVPPPLPRPPLVQGFDSSNKLLIYSTHRILVYKKRPLLIP